MRKDYSDYINKQFGELTILSISKPINCQRYCTCKCSCGKETNTRLTRVLNGETKSCGHLKTKDYSECIGKQFGELTILSISEPINRERYCTCKCSCGKEINACLRPVLCGRTKSCGHFRDDQLRTPQSEFWKCRNERKEANKSNTSTGIKNISYCKRDHVYEVNIKRNKTTYKERTSSLSEAIKIKERILQDLGELD